MVQCGRERKAGPDAGAGVGLVRAAEHHKRAGRSFAVARRGTAGARDTGAPCSRFVRPSHCGVTGKLKSGQQMSLIIQALRIHLFVPNISVQALEQAAVSSPDLASVLAGGVASVYLPDRAALMRGGALDWPFLPRGTQCVLLQSLAPAAAGSASSEKGVYSESRTSLEGDAEKKQLSGGGAGGLMVLWSNEPRALTRRQRLWAAAIAAKLGSMLSKHDARRSAAPV